MSASGDNIAARFAAAMRLAESRQLQSAAKSFGELARDEPSFAPARQMHAALLHQLGRADEALAETTEALTHAADDVALQCLHAEILLSKKQAAAAQAYAESALRSDPGRVSALRIRALSLQMRDRHREAGDALRLWLDHEPGSPAARVALVRSLLQSGEADAALRIAVDACVLDDADALAACQLAFAEHRAFAQRARLFAERAAMRPRDADAATAAAAALHHAGFSSASIAWADKALALQPDKPVAREIRAAALIDRGDVGEGLDGYRALLGARNDAATAARHLVLMHYDPALDNARLFAAHAAFVRDHVRSGAPRFVAPPGAATRRKRRIGWLSPRFGAGPVATFLSALLGAFDRSRHHHSLIDLQPTRDAAAGELYALADAAIDVSVIDDAALVARLRQLEFDVVVDLAGHATGNRIAALAARVAPLQICWLDYFDTTAVPAIDAWISDRWLTPVDSTQRFSERVVRLPSGRFCYTPPPTAPAAERIGADGIAFASYNRLAKLNDEVVATWAAILRGVDASTLELRSRLFVDVQTRERILARFASHGIDADRLRLHGEMPYAQLLDAYRRIDVALDPFPFSGCTTTCDALWMGCAVVTLPGEAFVSRQSASLLWRMRRGAWVASDRADYVARAIALAEDIESLRDGRARLRQDMRAMLCDARAQADDFAAAIDALVAGEPTSRL